MATLYTSSGDGLDNPREFVQAGWDKFSGLFDQWAGRTAYAVDLLTYMGNAPEYTWSVPSSIAVDYGTFIRPPAPVAPDVPAIDVALPEAPSLGTITVAEAEAAPASPDFSGLVYAKPAAPNRALPERPADLDVVLDEVVVPDAPAYSLPDDPTLYAIDLPAVPDLTLPTFEGVRPDSVPTAPEQTFAWQYRQYDMGVIDSIKSQLSNMSLAGLALPPAIEQAIFDRARGREDALSTKAIQEASTDLSDRGIRQPAGMLGRQVERVRAQSRQTGSAASRDVAIEIAKQNVEAVKFAIAQAISLEVALVQANAQQNDLELRAAQIGQQVVIDLFNAQVTLHNAQWEGYKADAQVFAERIRAIQAQADVYKSQIDAQKVIGDVNESLVRAYGERMRAIQVLGDFYKSSVDAARAKAEINTQKLEQVRVRLQAYDTDIQAWGKEWDGYKTSVEAELGSVRAYDVLGGVYGKRIDAWKAKRSAELDESRIQIEVEGQRLERYRALLSGAQTSSQVQLAAVDAVLRRYSTEGSVYAAQGQVAAAESAAHDRTGELRLGAARLEVDSALKNNELRANYALKAVDQAIEANRAKAQVLSQITSSLASGVNFGASYSGSLGTSSSYGLSYSGDADTAPYIPVVNG